MTLVCEYRTLGKKLTYYNETLQHLQSAFFPVLHLDCQVLLEKKDQDVIQVTEALTGGWSIDSPHTGCIFWPTHFHPPSWGPADVGRAVSSHVTQGCACVLGHLRKNFLCKLMA